MARSAPALSSFTAGEISPRLEGRVNIEKYREGLSDLTNMVVMPHGGVTRRPGTEYLGEVKSSAVKTRLIPFQFKTSDTYILEFGDQIMRVFRNGSQVLNSSSKTITAITKASPGVLTSNSHGFSNGDEVYITSVGGMTELNDRNYRIANVTTNTFTLTDLFDTAINTTSFTTFTSGGTATEIYEIATPFAEADTFNIRFAQSADTMHLVHPSYDIRTLTRTDHNAWSFATLSISGSPNPGLSGANNRPSVVTFFEQRLVFGNTNNNPQTLWFSKNGDYDNFTTGTGDNDALIYTIASNQVNAIRYLSATRVLTVGTSGGEYVVSASSDGPITPTTTLIRKYSNYGSAQVEPVQVADVTLFAQRGGRKVREFKYVGEVNTAGYAAPDMTILAEHITDGGVDQFAYQQEPDSVVWGVRSDGTLLGLTYRREEEVVAWSKHVMGGVFGAATITVSDYANIATGTTITITKSNGESVTFTSEAAGSSAPSSSTGFRPNTNNDTTADNIYTAINAHADFTVSNPSAAVVTIAESGRESSGYITVTSSDSTRLATTDESQSIVESISTLPTDSGEDELYMIVKRTINGATKRYVEVLKLFDFGSATTSAFFVDSGLSYSGSAITSLSGLYHLEGQTVGILANGASHPNKTVSNGSISLDFDVTSAAVGYGFTSQMQTLRIEAGSVDGTSQGKPKRIHAITLRLFETVGIEVGNSSTDLDRIPFRDSSMAMDEAVPLFTGDKEIEFRGGFSEDDRIYVQQSQALPLTILALYPRMNTFDV
jgi:hypothetical protein